MEEIVKQMWKNLSVDGKNSIGKKIKENVALAESLKYVKTPEEFFAEVVKVDAELFRFAPEDLKNNNDYVSSLITSSNENSLNKYLKKEENFENTTQSQDKNNNDFMNFVPTVDDVLGKRSDFKNVNEQAHIEQNSTRNISTCNNQQIAGPQVLAYRLKGAAIIKGGGLSAILSGIVCLIISGIAWLLGWLTYGLIIIGVMLIIFGIIVSIKNVASKASAKATKNQDDEAILETGNGQGVIIKDNIITSLTYSEITSVEKQKTEAVTTSDGMEILVGTLVIHTKSRTVSVDKILYIDLICNYLNSKIVK